MNEARKSIIRKVFPELAEGELMEIAKILDELSEHSQLWLVENLFTLVVLRRSV